MRILHVSDTHLGVERHLVGAPPEHRRHHDHLRALQLALEPAARQEIDLVVHSGDLFDRSRPSLRAMCDAAALLTEIARRTPIVIVHGNHGYRRIFPLPVPGLTHVDRPTRHVVGDVAIGLVPWASTATAWAHAARAATGPGVDLLVAHQAFDGARVPGHTFRVGVQGDTIGPGHIPDGVRHVLCGHIHPRQRVRVGEAEVVMPGSTERTSFSERTQVKGYAIWTLDGGVHAAFVDLPTRPMVVVAARADLQHVSAGALVHLSASDVEPAELLAHGGWWANPRAPEARPARDTSSLQPSLFPRR